MTKEYWLVTYVWRKAGDPVWHFDSVVINESPMKWIAEANRLSEEQYHLVNTFILSKEEFEAYRGYIG